MLFQARAMADGAHGQLGNGQGQNVLGLTPDTDYYIHSEMSRIFSTHSFWPHITILHGTRPGTRAAACVCVCVCMSVHRGGGGADGVGLTVLDEDREAERDGDGLCGLDAAICTGSAGDQSCGEVSRACGSQ